MDSKGQAYSVFKLLIAAIIAVAMLYILMSIIGLIVPPGNDVQNYAKQMIQKQKDLLGAMDTSPAVSFNAGTSLATKALVGNSGLTSDQICIHKGDFATNQNLSLAGNSIVNGGTSNLSVKARVVCDHSNNLVQTVEDLESGIDLSGDDGVCECPIESETATQLCCAVILKYA
ncbi:MAG: hypothetical protein JW744_03805 [Candidatus Diapherotrites archaeon]|uniref:Uncharacterized protein n=1 Tax=Candidatus Iainarchaeum sp. TaxID=3101447 RepID=A0A938YU42_9ARCH|nr:hypothetical protein [Candidatus Diapherotrites archaeon]